VFKRNKFKNEWDEERKKRIRAATQYYADCWYGNDDPPSTEEITAVLDKATGGFGVTEEELKYSSRVFWGRVADRENYGPFEEGGGGEFMIDLTKDPPMSGDPEVPHEKSVLSQEELQACVDAGNEKLAEIQAEYNASAESEPTETSR
jgi:hypothetical protein